MKNKGCMFYLIQGFVLALVVILFSELLDIQIFSHDFWRLFGAVMFVGVYIALDRLNDNINQNKLGE